ncbi:MAG: peroxiredoxin [Bryobacteraceae bacterium]|nr:peroxiredoxin [Bryobacteraceae bacterium]
MFAWLFSEPLKPGTPAPPFICRDEKGNVFILNQQRGKNVVLVFYPSDNTPVCTKQLCEFRDKWEQVLARNAVVYGVNPGLAEKHAGFREKHQFPFPLLVDDSQRVAKLYKASGLIVKRTVYVIDPQGTIAYGKRGKPPVEEVLAAVR